MKARNLIGLKFSKWTVLSKAGKNNSNKITWNCLCECGNISIVTGNNLTSNKSTSCGCNRIKHNMRDLPEYSIWLAMRDRCNNPNNKRYKDYGGRGIKVCKEWNSFETFLQDIGRKPTKTSSIDRTNNDLNYSSSNCEWVEPVVQANNRRKRKDGNKVTGVSYCKKSKKWRSTISICNTYMNLGYFVDWFEAVCARKSGENTYVL